MFLKVIGRNKQKQHHLHWLIDWSIDYFCYGWGYFSNSNHSTGAGNHQVFPLPLCGRIHTNYTVVRVICSNSSSHQLSVDVLLHFIAIDYQRNKSWLFWGFFSPIGNNNESVEAQDSLLLCVCFLFYLPILTSVLCYLTEPHISIHHMPATAVWF